jgi:hypothetical protein
MQIAEAVRAGFAHFQEHRNTADNEAVGRLRDDMKEGFRVINERLDRVDSSLTQGVGRFAVSDTKIARMEKDIDELKRKSPTSPIPAIREPKSEGGDEPPLVSQKFWNAIWLGIAGSIGAGIVAGSLMLSRAAAAPPASTPTVVPASVAPASTPAPAPTPAPTTP